MKWKKILSSILGLTIVLISGFTAVSEANSTPTITVGNYVQFGSYNGQPILWRVINTDTNGYMLFAEKIVSIKAFDGYFDDLGGRGDMDRWFNGSNFWEQSNLREWLNSEVNIVSYSGKPPSIDNLDYNSYSTEKGFLADGNFTVQERDVIQPVKHKVILSSVDSPVKTGGTVPHYSDYTNPSAAVANYDSAYYQDVTDKVFLLSIKELVQKAYSHAK